MILAGIFIVVLVLAHGLGVLAWLLAALASGVYYVRDVRRHDRVPCRVCGGGGAEASRMGGGQWFRRPFGDCWCCGGRKSHPRLALRVIRPARYAEIRDEIRKAKGKS